MANIRTFMSATTSNFTASRASRHRASYLSIAYTRIRLQYTCTCLHQHPVYSHKGTIYEYEKLIYEYMMPNIRTFLSAATSPDFAASLASRRRACLAFGCKGLAALGATRGQMDGFFGQPPYICHLEAVASVGD